MVFAHTPILQANNDRNRTKGQLSNRLRNTPPGRGRGRLLLSDMVRLDNPVHHANLFRPEIRKLRTKSAHPT